MWNHYENDTNQNMKYILEGSNDLLEEYARERAQKEETMKELIQDLLESDKTRGEYRLFVAFQSKSKETCLISTQPLIEDNPRESESAHVNYLVITPIGFFKLQTTLTKNMSESLVEQIINNGKISQNFPTNLSLQWNNFKNFHMLLHTDKHKKRLAIKLIRAQVGDYIDIGINKLFMNNTDQFTHIFSYFLTKSINSEEATVLLSELIDRINHFINKKVQSDKALSAMLHGFIKKKKRDEQ